MPEWAVVLIVPLILVVACLVFYLCFKVFNGPDGERYLRMRMQGPFVPLSEADIQADAERARSGRTDAAR